MELKLSVSTQNTEPTELLIVPYGIETINIAIKLAVFSSFNRTLWN